MPSRCQESGWWTRELLPSLSESLPVYEVERKMARCKVVLSGLEYWCASVETLTLLMSLAATVSPKRALRLGATTAILSVRYMAVKQTEEPAKE